MCRYLVLRNRGAAGQGCRETDDLYQALIFSS